MFLFLPFSIFEGFHVLVQYYKFYAAVPSSFVPCSLFPVLGSPFRVPISSAILQLQEAGRLHILKNRWWKQRRGGGKCDVGVSVRPITAGYIRVYYILLYCIYVGILSLSDKNCFIETEQRTKNLF